MFGKPKRSGKCQRCQSRGQCSCQRRDSAVQASKPVALAHCTQMCGWQKDKPCGRMARNGVCPCPNC